MQRRTSEALVIKAFSLLFVLISVVSAGPKADAGASSRLRGSGVRKALDGASEKRPHVQILDPWIRIPPPGAPMAALYFRIQNSGKTPFDVMGVRVDGAMNSEIHESSVDSQGMATMHPVSSLNVPPGEVRALIPGAMHVMVMGLTRPLKEGSEVGFEVHLKDGTSVTAKAHARP